MLKKYEEEIKTLKDMLAQFQNKGQSSNAVDIASAMKQMASFRDGNDMLLQKKEEEEVKEKQVTDFSVSELIAQLEAKGKKIAIIEPGIENQTSKVDELLGNDRADLVDSDHGDEETPNNGD